MFSEVFQVSPTSISINSWFSCEQHLHFLCKKGSNSSTLKKKGMYRLFCITWVWFSHISSVSTLHNQKLRWTLCIMELGRSFLFFLTRLTRISILLIFAQRLHKFKLISLLQASPAGWIPANMQCWSHIVWVKQECTPSSLHPLLNAQMLLYYYF